MMKLLHRIFFVSFIFPAAVTAQPFPNVLVDASAANGECTMIINPKNPDIILGAEIPDFIYRSADGGLTWTKTSLSGFSSLPIAWDVVLGADTAGRFYYQAMDQNSLFRTLRSDDFGLTWSVETSFGDLGCIEDKSWMTVDRSPSSPYNGRIYNSWTLRHGSGCNSAGYFFVHESTDNGQSWTARDTLDLDSSFVPPIGGGMAVNPSGDVGVTWCGGLPNQIHFKKSTDGGLTWSASPVIVDNNVQPNTDYAYFIDHSMGASSPFTSLACDISGGAYNGNFYCAWSDLRNGSNNADIFLARSTDGGQNWSTQRINDDNTVRNQILPTVAVDPSSGWVYVSYLDARLNTDNFDDTLHYYLAWSADGGQTFQNTCVSQQPSSLTWMHSDYMGMDAFQGKIHLLWVGGSSATGQQTWTATVNQSQLVSIAETTGPASGMKMFPAYPNPAIHFTSIDFELPEAGPVSLTLTDMEGRRLATVFSGKKYDAGRHQVRIDADTYHLPPGLYIATLSRAGESISRRFTVF